MALRGNRENESSSDESWEAAEDSTNESRPGSTRRERRREDVARQRAMLRDRRRSEPASPVGVIVVPFLWPLSFLESEGGLPALVRQQRCGGIHGAADTW